MSPSDNHPEGSALAEAEVKVALSAKEYAQLPAVLDRLGFTRKAKEELTDYYLSHARSSLGGWEFTRLRLKEDGARLTRKYWITDAQGSPVRMEEERKVGKDEADALLASAPTALCLRKQRATFAGNVMGETAEIALDRLELAGHHYYFLECEVMTHPDRARQVRENLLAWIRATLPVKAEREAESMLELLLRHTGDSR